MHENFHKIANKVSNVLGSPQAFVTAVLIIVVWIVSGPYFNYSNTWQLFINTGTTVATFLMVFLIQNTQNRDAKAIHIKLDELLKGVKGARTGLVAAEELSEKELDQLLDEYREIHERYEHEIVSRGGKLILSEELVARKNKK